jgi:hypothetical protein
MGSATKFQQSDHHFRLTFQEAMTLSPVGIYIHTYRTPFCRPRKYGIQ